MTKKIMKSYNNAFGYFKAYFFTTGLVGMACTIVAIFYTISEGFSKPIMYMGIMAGVFAVIGILIYINTLRKVPGKNPILLIFAMIFVSICVGFTICGLIGSIFFGNMNVDSNEVENKSEFAKYYIRESDGESFAFSHETGNHCAMLSSTNYNDTLIEVFVNGVSIQDSAGNIYRPL